MKNLILVLSVAILVLGCNSKTKNENAELKAALLELAEENAILEAGDWNLELEIEHYRAMLLELDENIASIDDKNHIVKGLAGGDEQDVEDDILLHLEHIHGTMTNSKHKIKQLSDNLDELYQDEEIDEEVILELEYALNLLADEILTRDVVIDALNEVVIEEGIDIAILSEAYVEQEVLSEMLFEILNTAYLVVGTKKELKEYGIIEKEGGFIGMARVKGLAADADDGLFVPIPIHETDDIELACKRAKLLTSHPESSYDLTGDKTMESLVILDPVAFWDKSDFLVIEIVE